MGSGSCSLPLNPGPSPALRLRLRMALSSVWCRSVYRNTVEMMSIGRTNIIFLVIAPYNKDSFVRFHAFQSIFLSAFYVVFFMAWSVIFGTLSVVNLGFLWSLTVLVWSLLRLAFFLLWLLMMYKAYNNERFSLPFIGPLAAKQAA
jgi:uncharacterized membrane protein